MLPVLIQLLHLAFVFVVQRHAAEQTQSFGKQLEPTSGIPFIRKFVNSEGAFIQDIEELVSFVVKL